MSLANTPQPPYYAVIFSSIRENEDEESIRNLRKCSMTGRPCGNDRFIKKLEKLFGRRLRALPWGRPRKNNK